MRIAAAAKTGVASAKPASTNREHRRRVGAGAEHANIAAFDPDIPGVKRKPDRPDPEPSGGKPFAHAGRPHRLLEGNMADRRKHRRDEAECRDDVGRHVGEPARKHRIGGPDDRRHERRRKTRRVGLAEPELGAAADEHGRADQSEQRAHDVMEPQPLLRQQAGEQHDQQRPKIVDEPGFGRRRKPQRREVKRVIPEQAAHTERPYFRRLSQCAQCARARNPGCGTEAAPDRKADRGKLKRGHLPG
jgi:hypothetical protein